MIDDPVIDLPSSLQNKMICQVFEGLRNNDDLCVYILENSMPYYLACLLVFLFIILRIMKNWNIILTHGIEEL